VKIDAGVIHLIPPIVVNVITNINCFLLIGNIKPPKITCQLSAVFLEDLVGLDSNNLLTRVHRSCFFSEGGTNLLFEAVFNLVHKHGDYPLIIVHNIIQFYTLYSIHNIRSEIPSASLADKGYVSLSSLSGCYVSVNSKIRKIFLRKEGLFSHFRHIDYNVH